MKEYFGTSVNKYSQPQDKFYTLFPGLNRQLPAARGEQTCLDLGCGTADLYDFITSKGYDYVGLDFSKDMLVRAKEKHPGVTFIEADASNYENFDKKFSVVLANMLFPSIGDPEAFEGIFATAAKLTKKDGLFLIGTIHPCFDGYMQSHLFERDDIKTNFTGYYKSGSNYKVYRKLQSKDFVFSDYHWQLADYFVAASRFGFYVDQFDECPLTASAPWKIVKERQKKGVPNYLVMRLKRLK